MYILNINLFLDMWFTNIFAHSVKFPFCFDDGFLEAEAF